MNSSSSINTINFHSKYPGAGKDTLQKRVFADLQESQIPAVSFGIGDIVRWHKQNQTKLGLELSRLPESKLAPNRIILPMTTEYVEALNDDEIWLMNGMPREAEQVKFYIELMRKHRRNVLELFIHVDREEADRRMEKRAERASDKDPVQRGERLDEADREFAPISEYLLDQGNTRTLNGMQDSVDVHKEARRVLTEEGVPLNASVLV